MPVKLAGVAVLPVCVLVSVAWCSPARAQGSQDKKLACQAYLAHSDCTKNDGPAGTPLTLVASCQECSGSGANITCGSAEKVSAGILSLRTTDGKTVSGSFQQVKLCIGSPLFTFDGALPSGDLHLIGAFGDPHGDVLLLSFNTTGGSAGRDGGPVAGRDGGGATSDSGGTATADGGGGNRVDGGNPPGTGDDGGCSCRAMSGDDASGAAVVLVALGLIALVRRSRLSRNLLS